MMVAEATEADATLWAMALMMENVQSRPSYRSAALATLDAVRARGCLEQIAETITVAGFMELARRQDHRERKGLDLGTVRARRVMATPPAGLGAAITARNGGTRLAVWDMKFYIPGHGRVPLHAMTRPMLEYKRDLYAGMEAHNGFWRRFFDRLLPRLPDDEATTVGDVFAREEVEGLVEK